MESETVTAGVKPLETSQSNAQSEAETEYLERSQPGRARRNVLLVAALAAAVGVGVVASIALGVGGDDKTAGTPTPTPKPGDTATPTATAAAKSPTIAGDLTIGKRPNVVRVSGDNVFVGSFQQSKLRIVSAKTGKVKPYSPAVGIGVDDGALGFGSLWLSVARATKLVRLDEKTGKPRGAAISLPYSPSAVAVSKDAVWVSVVPGNEAPDQLLKIDPKTGQTLASVSYPYGIMSITASPSAVWVAARRRARVQRVDPKTGEIVRTVLVGRNRSEDLAYHAGAVWAATPEDGNVYKILTASGSVIPISVGKQPRQLTISDGVVYVTNYSSSDLYAIDEKSSRVLGPPLGLPVNPFSLATDASGATLWVGSQPENKLTKVTTGRG